MHDPDHGTRDRYRDGCRCDPCRDAFNVYREQVKLRHGRGEVWADHDDVVAAAGRVVQLMDRFGLTRRGVMQSAGIHDKTMANLLAAADGARVRVRHHVLDRLDGLTKDDIPDNVKVRAGLLHEQVDRLTVQGATSRDIAAGLGWVDMPGGDYWDRTHVFMGTVRRAELAADMWPHVPTDTCEDCDTPTPLWLRWCGPCGDTHTLPTTPEGWARRRRSQARQAYRLAARDTEAA